MNIRRIFAGLLTVSIIMCFTACNEEKVTSKGQSGSTDKITSEDSAIVDTNEPQESIDTQTEQEESNLSSSSSEKKETVVYDSSEIEEVVIVDNKRSIKTYKNKWGVYEMLKSYTGSTSKVTAEEFITINKICAFEAVVLSLFSSCKSSIALIPIGVAALSSPKTLEAIFITIAPKAGESFFISGIIL